MRRFSILAALLILGGCSTAPKIVDWDREQQQKADDALAEYIEENRQIVYMPANWQVMAYCKESTVSTVVEKKTTLLCQPPKTANTDVTTKAKVYVVMKRLPTAEGKPAAWYARYDNFTDHDLCLNAQWRLMEIKADDALSEWQIVPARSRLGVGYLRQEVWKIDGKILLLDYSGHVASLLLRPVSSDGTCYEMAEEDEVRPDQ